MYQGREVEEITITQRYEDVKCQSLHLNGFDIQILCGVEVEIFKGVLRGA